MIDTREALFSLSEEIYSIIKNKSLLSDYCLVLSERMTEEHYVEMIKSGYSVNAADAMNGDIFEIIPVYAEYVNAYCNTYPEESPYSIFEKTLANQRLVIEAYSIYLSL